MSAGKVKSTSSHIAQHYDVNQYRREIHPPIHLLIGNIQNIKYAHAEWVKKKMFILKVWLMQPYVLWHPHGLCCVIQL